VIDLVYTIQEGFERSSGSDWDDYLLNTLIDYGFTHEAYVPGLTSYRVSQGESPKQYVGSIALPMATAFAITAWATGQAHVSLASAAFTAVTGVSPGAALTGGAVLAAPIVASAVVTTGYIGLMDELKPEEPTHQPSFWNSIAAAMAGTFGGVQLQ
jgi:hypothetical protein